MRPQVIQQRPSFFATIGKWFFVIVWRFFSGAHLDGAKHNDSTWWLDASPRYPARKRTWWKRKSRAKRAAWRHCIFWPVLLITWAFIFYTSSALIVAVCLLPGAVFMAWGRVRLALYHPVAGIHSDGSKRQHWILKPRVKRALARFDRNSRKRNHPGIVKKSEKHPRKYTEDIPQEWKHAVVLELAEELDGQPPLELKLLMNPELES
jgi:hypothetical protein